MAIAERADYRASKRGKGAKQRERARERERGRQIKMERGERQCRISDVCMNA